MDGKLVTPIHYVSLMFSLLSCSVVMFLSDMTGRAPRYQKYALDLFHLILCALFVLLEVMISFVEVFCSFLLMFSITMFCF